MRISSNENAKSPKGCFSLMIWRDNYIMTVHVIMVAEFCSLISLRNFLLQSLVTYKDVCLIIIELAHRTDYNCISHIDRSLNDLKRSFDVFASACKRLHYDKILTQHISAVLSMRCNLQKPTMHFIELKSNYLKFFFMQSVLNWLSHGKYTVKFQEEFNVCYYF